jgi:ketosteroid isomerase-like protein
VIVEVKGDNAVAGSDRRYQNDYLFLVQCRDGKIAHIFEYSNPMVYAAAVNG